MRAPAVESAAPGGLPDLVVVALTLATVGLLLALLTLASRRNRGPGADGQGTYRALHAASRAARHLRQGLSPNPARRAAGDLLPLLGVTAVAFADSGGPLAWVGPGEHHRAHLGLHAPQVLQTGRTTRLAEPDLACADPNCRIANALLAPVVSNDTVVAVLGVFDLQVGAGLARATEAVADWVSVQVELTELERERGRVTEAELRALRAQISPHFIFNSLAAIASFVRTDPERARELLLEFADFTRYSFRHADPYTTLADELTNIERYLALESARFGDRLSVSLLVAPEVLPVRVPTFAVQPLVENAVRHGIEAREGPGRVSISAVDHGTEAEIVIEDDGAGADPESVRAVLSGDRSEDHVGLANVDGRLRQSYGDTYGLVVETAPGAGTRVSFRVPKYVRRPHG